MFLHLNELSIFKRTEMGEKQNDPIVWALIDTKPLSLFK